MRALLIGGYQDGVVMDVPMMSDSIEGLTPPHFRLQDVHLGTIHPPTKVRYQRQVLTIWDVSIPVYILVGWPQERIEATLAKVLLSDVAHGLAETLG